MLRPKPSNNKVILYMISVNNGLGSNGLVKKLLMSGNAVFEERNCSTESEYMRELEELVGNDRVRFPMVIVNGKDLCGAEEVEGLDDFENKQKLISVLNHLYVSAKTIENLHGMQQSTFIQNTVKLFRETLAAKFPECRLPEPERSVLRDSSSSNVKVILYTTSANNGLDANGWAKKVLLSGKLVFEERNCSKEPIYLKELEELVGKEKVRFPMVIVNGKDLNYVILRIVKARHNDKVDKWKEALAEVGNILGQHVEGLQSTFIQNIVKLFREKLAAKFPECRLPTLEGPSSQGSSSSSMLRPKPSNDKVILYTISVNNGLGANGLVKKLLMSGNVVFEERNCSTESEYMRELEELVGNDRVRFPMVIVNGKDLCGEEEVEGLDDFENKQKLISVLNHLYVSAKTIENLRDMFSRSLTFQSSIQDQWINRRYS
ncbi:hypothetical protein ACET3Z_005389 [Daucus carota]